MEYGLQPKLRVFIEKHEFIQMITPSNDKCGGFVILGRVLGNNLELIAIKIPFGYTLLVEPFAIHGDSYLIGTYIMAMTGNHLAMETADTVYLKNKFTAKNVEIIIDSKEVINDHISVELYITSDQMPLKQLHILNRELIDSISHPLPVVYTPNNSLGWTKTIGISLPRIFL